MPGAAGAASAASGERVVEVAIDAAGGGGARTYTYTVPPSLVDLVPGEAVLVEFGRRQALAVVLGEANPSRRHRTQTDCRTGPDGWAAPPAALTRLCPLDLGPLSRPAGDRHPGDAAAGPPRTARPRRGATARGYSGRPGGRRPGPPRTARPRPACRPRPRRAGGTSRPDPAAPRPRIEGAAGARLDAICRWRRPSLRALAPAHDRGQRGGGYARRR